MEISFIHVQILVRLHVNKTNFHMKDFAPGLGLRQTRKATRKSPNTSICVLGDFRETAIMIKNVSE